VDDPLAEEVVSAYWVGGDLVDRADPAALVDFLLPRFAGQLGGTWREARDRALPQHSFHVFEVYPWAALLRRMGNPAAVAVLDRCRIRTGIVRSVDGESAVVGSRPLVVAESGAPAAGPLRDETVTWSASLLPGLAPGDRVALHWAWVCDVLTEEQAAVVEQFESMAVTH
jgi:hypothetical protein